jgi:hypothetical protein
MRQMSWNKHVTRQMSWNRRYATRHKHVTRQMSWNKCVTRQMYKKYILKLSKSTANSCTLTLMMDGSIFHLLEVIYAKNVACEVQKIRNERCCGCKIYEQNCLMMDKHETWEMHGLNATEQANNTSSTVHTERIHGCYQNSKRRKS